MTQRTSLCAFVHPYQQSLANTPYSLPASSTECRSPRNANGSAGEMFTMRRGLENSINLVTAHLLTGGIISPIAYLRSQRKRPSYEIAAKG